MCVSVCVCVCVCLRAWVIPGTCFPPLHLYYSPSEHGQAGLHTSDSNHANLLRPNLFQALIIILDPLWHAVSYCSSQINMTFIALSSTLTISDQNFLSRSRFSLSLSLSLSLKLQTPLQKEGPSFLSVFLFNDATNRNLSKQILK
ncbi:hypothetical protein GQ43DRAFT_268192 [Delitschia confertaspora ATCC 74209]|uniref:Secreted protein n=1 Tax=Delitschia confertaspora ATCC 74209 TaxID=1513339 RepID=A0A9P4JFD9_9PLEO|nr:hypothetical protein GQ43DRAFT_268192 [Delitschia confertaspora ATCC 74209]